MQQLKRHPENWYVRFLKIESGPTEIKIEKDNDGFSDPKQNQAVVNSGKFIEMTTVSMPDLCNSAMSSIFLFGRLHERGWIYHATCKRPLQTEFFWALDCLKLMFSSIKIKEMSYHLSVKSFQQESAEHGGRVKFCESGSLWCIF